MKSAFLASAATLALISSSATAEQLTVFGTWLGPDQEYVEAVSVSYTHLTLPTKA